MTAFDDAWNVLKMGTYEEEERDMGYMPGRRGKKLTPEMIRQIMQQAADRADMNRPPPMKDFETPSPYDRSYPTPPNPYRDKNQPNPFDPYKKKPTPGGQPPWTPPGGPNKPPYKPYPGGDDDWVTCPDCGQKYKKGWDMATGMPKRCPCKDGDGSATPNPYGPPPGAPPSPFQPNTIGFPKDWQVANMTSNPPQ
tara:strand:- start:312 stop:896 length:585 start_codon:yes stop_codon:yes gene_type:complete